MCWRRLFSLKISLEDPALREISIDFFKTIYEQDIAIASFLSIRVRLKTPR